MDYYLLGFVGLVVLIGICAFILYLRSLPPAKSPEYVRKRFYRYVVFKPLGNPPAYGTCMGSMIAETDTRDEAITIRNSYPNPKQLLIIMRMGGEDVRDGDGKAFTLITREEEERLRGRPESFVIGENARVSEQG